MMSITRILLFSILAFSIHQEDIRINYSKGKCTNCKYSDKCTNVVTITNASDERVYSWIDFNYDPSLSQSRNIKMYVCKPHGDFNLITLLTDNVIFIDNEPIIGAFFITIIEPNETFIYLGVKDETILNNIVTVKESQFKQIMGFPLSDGYINKEAIYWGNQIDLRTAKCI